MKISYSFISFYLFMEYREHFLSVLKMLTSRTAKACLKKYFLFLRTL